MDTTLTVQLLANTLSLPDLSIGQAIDIAQIPQKYNEKRLSALIGHLTGDLTLAGSLTAQERYYFLLSHQSITENRYSDDNDSAAYFIDTIQSDVPQEFELGAVTISHLTGTHTCVLEGICENVADWVFGKMACQLSGDLSSFVGGDNPEFIWEKLPDVITDNELDALIQGRVTLLNTLSVDKFNDLSVSYDTGVSHLAHFLILGNDNEGLTVMCQGGEGAGKPSRFLTLDHLQGTARTLADCVA